MTSLAWASLIIPPTALVIFIPMATYLFLLVTKRSPGGRLRRVIDTFEDVHLQRTWGGGLMAIGFVTISQFLATVLILDGLGRDPVAHGAVIAGGAEWCAALAWMGALFVGSTPPAPSGPSR